MPQLFGLARLGKDAELRSMQNGDSVVNLALAFNYGRKGDDGKHPTQWLDAALYGKRAEALAPYLTKGTQALVTVGDVHIETYEGKNGTGSKLVGRVTEIELASGGQRSAAPAPAPAPRPQQSAPANRFEDMDDDIPF